MTFSIQHRCALLIAGLAISVASTAAEPKKRVLVWETKSLFEKPKVHQTKVRPAKGMRSFFYEGADYKGKPTWVFAYYAAPAGEKPEGGWPAVVCAHGGGGTAFPAWVKHWNKKGYAAIAMDLEGHIPGGNHFGVEGSFPANDGHKNAGPKRIGWFGDIALPNKEQWFYHAVADVVRANSLLRKVPEINPKKIGLTGISWGGTIVSAVAGVDSRFAFVIPVYGGGFIHKHKMSPEQYREYLTKWDPSAHLPHAKMPMLWVNGVNEPVFPFDGFSRSAGIAGGSSSLCIRPFLPHGHGFGWDEVWEIGGFADGVVNGGKPIPKIGRPRVDPKDGLVHVPITGEFKSAVVGFTKAKEWKNQALSSIPCRIEKNEIIATKPLPKGATAFMINAKAGGVWNDGCVSSVLVVAAGDEHRNPTTSKPKVAAADEPMVFSDPAKDPTKPAAGGVRWFWPTHARNYARRKAGNIDLCFLGDSITQGWPGDLFKDYYGKLNSVNFGCGGDKIQHLLMRLEGDDGELHEATPRVVVLLIGINNMGDNSAEEIAYGTKNMVKRIKSECPKTQVLLLGILPTKGTEGDKIKAVNVLSAKLDDGKSVRFLDMGTKFLGKDGKAVEALYRDDVHLSRKGYQLWHATMNPLL
ncbi:MAG: lysophospholipase L1-like esterase/dienelactone hydrolase, partial [Verrucomicrobiales bacterium]